MARYLSPEWVQSFDAALSALDLSDVVAAAGAGSLAAADGTFSVVQVVTGVPTATAGPDEAARAPTADVRVVLTVADGRARLALDPSGDVTGTATIVLGYADAAAMARGELDPADALAAGRIRVRGDLAALVAGQDVLAAAATRLGTDLVNLTDLGHRRTRRTRRIRGTERAAWSHPLLPLGRAFPRGARGLRRPPRMTARSVEAVARRILAQAGGPVLETSASGLIDAATVFRRLMPWTYYRLHRNW